MYLAGVSVRRIEDITEALWGTKVSPGTISHLNKKAYEHIESWRSRPLTGEYAYVYLDGAYLKRSWGGEIQNVSILLAIGVDSDGHREILGAAEGMKEDHESWRSFFVWLKERGLKGVRLFVGDKNLGMLETINEVFPDSRYQRCVVHFYRNVFSVIPRGKVRAVSMMLKAIHSQESKETARAKAKQVASKLREMRLSTAARKVEESIEETLTFMEFPSQHWTRIRTNNLLDGSFGR
jgi:putative transposase